MKTIRLFFNRKNRRQKWTIHFLLIFIAACLLLPAFCWGASHYIYQKDRVPEVLWTRGCSPTAASMAVGYYDNYIWGSGGFGGYGRLIDYWHYQSYIYSGNTYYENAPNLLNELADAMGTDTNGSTSPNNIGTGLVNATNNSQNNYSFSSTLTRSYLGWNDWCWPQIEDEIDNKARPFIWSVMKSFLLILPGEGHSLCAIGYCDTYLPDKYVIVYDTWSCGEHLWQYNLYNNSAAALYTQVDTVEPGGSDYPTYLALNSPSGGDVITGSLEIKWYQWSTNIDDVDIYYSTNEGRNWSSVDYFVPSSEGWNTYVWDDHGIDSDDVRIKIKGFQGATYAAGDGNKTNFTLQEDTTPPTPNPLYWSTLPYQLSTSSIRMTSATASDPSTPIEYYFDYYTSPTGGSGGSDSGWQTSTTYTDYNLLTNHQYGYRVKARDGSANHNETSYSALSYEYTSIETPAGVSSGTITNYSIQVKSSNTPSGLTRGSSGLIIYNVTRGTNSGWKQNNNYWTSGSLSPNTQYSFRAKARNGDGNETGYSPLSNIYTLANQPGTASFSNITDNSIQANWTTNGNPGGTYYYCENTTKGTNSGWTSNTSWNSTGLNCETSYSFRVKARNGSGAETSWTSLGSQSTSQCPVQPLNAANLVSPPNGASNQPTSLSVQWQDTNSNPQEQGYRIRTKPAGGNYTYYAAPQNATSYPLSGLANSTTYYWNVQAIGDGNNTTDSPWANSGTDWSFTTAGLVEIISTPDVPSGTANGIINTNYTYSTGGSTSNLGHPIQYLFDWGDGTDSGWLPVGTTTASHSWSTADTYQVKAKARCSIHTSVESDWSSNLTVNITEENDPHISSLNPSYGPIGTAVTISGSYFGSSQGTVTFNSTNASITSWSDTEISTIVPNGATTGPVVVHTSDGKDSNGVVFTVGDGERILIIDLDGNNNSAPEIQSAVEANGFQTEYVTSVPASINPATYPVVFVCLGVWSQNHVLTQTEGEDLKTYLDNGGGLYMESNDTWVYDAQTPVHPYFGIKPLSDGSNDTSSIAGIQGTFTQGFNFLYEGDNSYMDQIDVADGVTNAYVIWDNQSPAYHNGVARDTGSYKTIGVSFEFGGIPTDLQNNVMGKYLNFLTTGEPMIKVISPNGGEKYNLGIGLNITWECQGVSGDLKIYLFKDGAVVGTIAKNLAPASGAYLWTVGEYEGGTAVPGTGYTIKIKEMGVTRSDFSDAPFTICSLAVTSPNGGEDWQSGSTHNITWNCQEITGDLKIYLWKDGALVGTIASNIDPADGSYPWTVGQYEGGTAAPGTGYTIKIKEMGVTVSDFSNASFTISPTGSASITVTSPNGGENWKSGSAQNITWTTQGVTNNLKIFLFKDGAVVDIAAKNIAPAPSGSYPWIVGQCEGGNISVGTGYTIKVKEMGVLLSDFSDAPFTITGITVTAPNGGESWPIGATRNITWNTQGVTGNLKIYLWKDGALVGTIDKDIDPASGSYAWTVGQYEGGTASAGTGYTIKVKEMDVTVADFSDAAFTLTN